MNVDWQTPIAVLCVIGAAGYLLSRLWAKPGSGCGSSCGGCPSAADSEPSFVELQVVSPERRPHQNRF